MWVALLLIVLIIVVGLVVRFRGSSTVIRDAYNTPPAKRKDPPA